MSDQMPDEVWVNAVRYIRAEKAEAERRRTASRLIEVLVQYTAARDDRDRLRAALAAIEAMPYRGDRPLRLMDASRAAREALDHAG